MPEVICPSCGTRLNAPEELVGSQVTCGQCQKIFIAAAGTAPPGPYLPPTRPGAPPPPVSGPLGGQAPTSGAAIASLVLGISSFPGCVCMGLPGILCGVLAIIFAGIARNAVAAGKAGGASSGMAKAGTIVGICGIVVTLIFWSLYLYVNYLQAIKVQSGNVPF